MAEGFVHFRWCAAGVHRAGIDGVESDQLIGEMVGQGASDGGDNHRRIGQWRQLCEVYSVLKIPQEGGGYLNAQAGLTGTGRACEGEQAHFGLPQPGAYVI